MTPRELYHAAVNTPSDINEHVPTLRDFARKCEHVTELGTRYGTSAIGFCSGCSKVVSYDIARFPNVDRVEAAFPGFEARIGNSLLITIEPTDLLFVDTIHTYAQVKGELFIHSQNVRKWILLHDTVTFGRVGDDGGPGINLAIEEFLASHISWKFVQQYMNNNGLTVLERVPT